MLYFYPLNSFFIHIYFTAYIFWSQELFIMNKIHRNELWCTLSQIFFSVFGLFFICNQIFTKSNNYLRRCNALQYQIVIKKKQSWEVFHFSVLFIWTFGAADVPLHVDQQAAFSQLCLLFPLSALPLVDLPSLSLIFELHIICSSRFPSFFFSK